MNRVLRLTAIATIAVFAVSTPTISLGALSADKKQIARTFKQLKRLLNAGASAPIVRQLVRKLSILNPKGASTYL